MHFQQLQILMDIHPLSVPQLALRPVQEALRQSFLAGFLLPFMTAADRLHAPYLRSPLRLEATAAAVLQLVSS